MGENGRKLLDSGDNSEMGQDMYGDQLDSKNEGRGKAKDHASRMWELNPMILSTKAMFHSANKQIKEAIYNSVFVPNL